MVLSSCEFFVCHIPPLVFMLSASNNLMFVTSVCPSLLIPVLDVVVVDGFCCMTAYLLYCGIKTHNNASDQLNLAKEMQESGFRILERKKYKIRGQWLHKNLVGENRVLT